MAIEVPTRSSTTPTPVSAVETPEALTETHSPATASPGPAAANEGAARAASDLASVEKKAPRVRVTSLPPAEDGELEGEIVAVLNVGDTRASAQLNNPDIAQAASTGVDVSAVHRIDLSTIDWTIANQPEPHHNTELVNPYRHRSYSIGGLRSSVYGNLSNPRYETPRPITPTRQTSEPDYPEMTPAVSTSRDIPTYETFIMNVSGVHDMGTDNKSHILVRDETGNIVRTIPLQPGDSRFQVDLLRGSQYTFEAVSGGEGKGEEGQDQRDNFQVQISRPPESSASDKPAEDANS